MKWQESIGIEGVECKKCGYKWHPHTSYPPKKCANCSSMNWNKEKKQVSEPNIHLKITKRDCSKCGTKENLQIHHISYKPEVITILCVDCHSNEHGHGVGRSFGRFTEREYDSIEGVSDEERDNSIILKCQCNRCGYEWWPRSPEEPKNCPNPKCNSPYWNKGRVR